MSTHEGDRVQGVGQGTVLAGRYAVQRRLSQRGDLQHWSAHDTTLERDVHVTVFAADHPGADAILDAARRAAGIEDARLVRILDAGSHEQVLFIVQELLLGAESLATLLEQGPLPAEEARRIAGEVAAGLETARQRGLHHLRLTPHAVCRASDGSVRISGVAVAAAMDGAEEPDSAAASRTDAKAVVALAYAALTSRWPLPGAVPGVEPAPRVVGGVAAPSEIAAGVPGDLDALCRVTLNDDVGPRTPGEFAAQIAPWSRAQVRGRVSEPTVALTLPVGYGPAGQGATPGDATRDDATGDHLTGQDVLRDGPDAGGGVLAGASTSDGAAAAAARGAAGISAVTGAALGRVGSFARAAADKAATLAATRSSAASLPDPATGQGEGAGAAGAPSASALRTAPGGPGATAGSTTATATQGHSARELPDVLGRDDGQAEPPLPMLPQSTAQPPPPGQSRTVVLIVSAFVLLSLVAGYCGIRGLGSNLSLPAELGGPSGSSAPAATSSSAPPSAGPTGTAGAGDPIAILSAKGFDPEGDKQERNSAAPKVYDGTASTAWTSEGYNSRNLGGLKKGVGVILDLGQEKSVAKVTLTLSSTPQDVVVYATNRAASLEGATALGAKAAATGTVDIAPTSPSPRAQFVVVWFTSAAPDGGKFRATLAEVALS